MIANKISDFGLSVLFYLVIFSQTQFKVFGILFMLVCWLLCYIPRQIGSLKLKKIARKFNLEFNKNYFIYFPESKDFNIIKGSINGKNIEVSYLCKYAGRGERIDGIPGIFYRQTKIKIGDVIDITRDFKSVGGIADILKGLTK